MRLYYMTTLETLESYILPDQRIRLSTFDTVNDPFELLGATQGGEKVRRQFDWLYKHWVETLGFVSFSDNWKSPLMWAHYARNHTGVCLGIEVPKDLTLQVNYEPHRLQMLLDMTRLDSAIDDDVINKVITTKFKEWEYEREWRVVDRLENRDDATGFYYRDFTPDFELREIILGVRCVRTVEQIANQVFGVTDNVYLRRARAAFGAFSMVNQRLVRPIVVEPMRDRPQKRGNKKIGRD